MYIELQYVIALVAGILILAVPKFLRYIVAIYLIAYAVMGLMRW